MNLFSRTKSKSPRPSQTSPPAQPTPPSTGYPGASPDVSAVMRASPAASSVSPGTSYGVDATLKPTDGPGGVTQMPKRKASVIEMLEYVKGLNIDPTKETDMLWIAEEAYNAPLPPGWSDHQDAQGRLYFHSSVTAESVWRHPMDDLFRDVVGYQRQVVAVAGFWEVEDEIAKLEENIRVDLADWMELFDDKTQKFFYNRKTDESRFDDPRVAVYHSLYTRIKMVAKMKERMPVLARNTRPPAALQQTLAPAASSPVDEASAPVQDQTSATVQDGLEGVVQKGPQPLKGKLRLRMESVGADGTRELVLAQTTPHRRAKAATKIQSRARGIIARKRFRPLVQHRVFLSHLVAKIQRMARAWLARRKVGRRRVERGVKAATTIQRFFRGHRDRKFITSLKAEKLRFLHMQKNVVIMQSGCRMHLNKKKVAKRRVMQKSEMVARIQRQARVHLARQVVSRFRVLAEPIQAKLVITKDPAARSMVPWSLEVMCAPWGFDADGPISDEEQRAAQSSYVNLFNEPNGANVEEYSATKIQARFRGKQTRQETGKIAPVRAEASPQVFDDESPEAKDEALKRNAQAALEAALGGFDDLDDGLKRNAQAEMADNAGNVIVAQEDQESLKEKAARDKAATQIQARSRGRLARSHVQSLQEEALWPMKSWFEFCPTGPDTVQMEVRFVPNPRFDDYKYFERYAGDGDDELAMLASNIKDMTDVVDSTVNKCLGSAAAQQVREEAYKTQDEDRQRREDEFEAKERRRRKEAEAEAKKHGGNAPASLPSSPTPAASVMVTPAAEQSASRRPSKNDDRRNSQGEARQPSKAKEDERRQSKPDARQPSKKDDRRNSQEEARQPSQAKEEERRQSKPDTRQPSKKDETRTSTGESRPKAEPEPKPRAESKPKAEPKVELKEEPRAQPKSEPKVEKVVAADATLAPQKKDEPKAKAEPRATSKQAEDEPKSRTEAKAEAKRVPKPKPEPKAKVNEAQATAPEEPAKTLSGTAGSASSSRGPSPTTKAKAATLKKAPSPSPAPGDEQSDHDASRSGDARVLPPVAPPTRKLAASKAPAKKHESIFAQRDQNNEAARLLKDAHMKYRDLPPEGSILRPQRPHGHPDATLSPAPPSPETRSPADASAAAAASSLKLSQSDGAIEGLGAVAPPTRKTYGGTLVGKTFVRNGAETVEDMSEAQKQECIEDIQRKREQTLLDLKEKKKVHKQRKREHEDKKQEKYQAEMSGAQALEDERRAKKVKELKKWLKLKEEQVRAKKEREEAMISEVMQKETEKQTAARILEEKRVVERERRLEIGDRQKAKIQAEMQRKKAEKQALKEGMSRSDSAPAGMDRGIASPNQVQTMEPFLGGYPQQAPSTAGGEQRIVHRHIHHHVHYHEGGEMGVTSGDEEPVSPAQNVNEGEQRQIEMASEARVKEQLERSGQAPLGPNERSLSQHFHQHLGIAPGVIDPSDPNALTPSNSMSRLPMGAMSDGSDRTQEAFYRGALPRAAGGGADSQDNGKSRGLKKYAANVDRSFGAYADAGRPKYRQK